MIGRYRQACRSATKSTLVLGYALLALAALALGYFLGHAEKPWENGLEARIADGRDIELVHHVITGMWYGAWINLGLCTLLGLAMPFLTRSLGPFELAPAGVSPRSRAIFILATLAALAVAASLCIPRLGMSLSVDEEFTLRRRIAGEQDAGDAPQLRPVPWAQTLWLCEPPNDHLLSSVLSRISHEALFRQSQDPQNGHFNESIIRLPAFLAALGAIAATGYALACIGFLRAGILAMFLLSLHPWFIRFGTETRGDAFVLLLVPLAVAFLIKAVRRGRWRYWIGYAACEFLMVTACPGSICLLIPLNASGFLLALSARGGWPNRRVHLGRLMAANTSAAMLAIQLIAPCYTQRQANFSTERSQAPQGLDWIGDHFSYLATGMPWQVWDADSPLCHSLAQRPLLGAAFLLVAGAAFLAGLARLFTASLQTRYLLAFFAMQWPLVYFVCRHEGQLVYHWYSIPMLVPFLMAVALGIEWVSRARIWGGRSTLPWLGTSAVYIALFVAVASPEIRSLRENPAGLQRDPVSATRRSVNPYDPDTDGIVTFGSHTATRTHTPATHFVPMSDRAGRSQGVLARAKLQNRPRCVNLAMRELARIGLPDIMRTIGDPQRFTPLDPIWWMADNTDRHFDRNIDRSGPE